MLFCSVVFICGSVCVVMCLGLGRCFWLGCILGGSVCWWGWCIWVFGYVYLVLCSCFVVFVCLLLC